MDLWNITDLRQMDPVIDLILDVIAYNSSRLHQNISDSDSNILYRLACLLVPQQLVTFQCLPMLCCVWNLRVTSLAY